MTVSEKEKDMVEIAPSDELGPEQPHHHEDFHLSPMPTNVTTASEVAISPRVSTAGTEESIPHKHTHFSSISEKEGDLGAPDYTAPGLDSLHWAGVKKRGDFDQRSIASSMNAERDDKSVYEESAVGILEGAMEDMDGSAEAVAARLMKDSVDMTEEMGMRDPQSSIDAELGDGETRQVEFVEEKVVAHALDKRDKTVAVSLTMRSDGDGVVVGIEDVGASQGDTESVATKDSLPQEPPSGGMPIPAGSSAYSSSVPSPRSPHVSSPQWSNGAELGKSDEDLPEIDVAVEHQEESTEVAEKLQITQLDDEDDSVDPLRAEDESAGQEVSETVYVEDQMHAVPPPKARQNEDAPTTLNPEAAVPAPIPRVDMGPEWEAMFKGLVYEDGVDALGRPVIVLDADAVPPRMKSSALTYVKTHLEPVVTSGDYVIVFTAEKAKLPTFWIMGAYQTLPRPFRKNVQYIILVRPSGFLRAILAFMRPFVSKKAGRKIKLVESLEEIGEATSGEVTMHHLGQGYLNRITR